MNFAKRLFTIAAAVLITSAAFAQLSDQQVIDELKKYSTSGKTQEQVLMELAGKGVTKEQLERIKKTYDAQSKGVQGTQTKTGEDRERETNLNFPDPAKWDDIVKSFPNYDVYYLSGYVKAFQVHGDGEALLLYYQSSLNLQIY